MKNGWTWDQFYGLLMVLMIGVSFFSLPMTLESSGFSWGPIEMNRQ